MGMIGWLLTIGFGLGGLALRAGGGLPTAGAACLALAVLACPLLWAREGGLFAWAGATRKDRIMLALALVLSAPLVLPLPV